MKTVNKITHTCIQTDKCINNNSL